MRWLGVLCLAMITAPVVAQCAPDASARAASLVQQRQADLLKVTVPEMSTEVPQAARRQITLLKDALVDAVDAEMRCSPASESVAAMQAHLTKLMSANLPAKPFVPSAKGTNKHEDAGAYGGDLKITVSTPASLPRMLAVQMSFGIECGTDTLLLLYESRPAGWTQTLRWQSLEYADISGAFGGFFLYTILPGNSPGSLRLAVAHGTDWCTSRWSGFDLDVLAPAAKVAAPRVVWHQRQSFVIESDPRMVARPDGFELRLDVGTIESDQMVRKGIFRYKVVGDAVERAQPIAVDGRGFVDAWLQAPWSDAKRWSLPAGAAGFEQAHEAFARSRKDTAVTYAYGPVRACSVKGRYEVQIDAAPGGPQFYAVEQGQNGYTMVNFGTTQDDRCSGPDLMKKR